MTYLNFDKPAEQLTVYLDFFNFQSFSVSIGKALVPDSYSTDIVGDGFGDLNSLFLINIGLVLVVSIMVLLT